MREINYQESVDIINSINNKIIAIIITKEGCPACSLFIDNAVLNIEKKYSDIFEAYKIEHDNIPTAKIFPVLQTPITYFFIKGSDVFPIIRPGVANLDQLENEILKFKLILKGDKFQQVFNK